MFLGLLPKANGASVLKSGLLDSLSRYVDSLECLNGSDRSFLMPRASKKMTSTNATITSVYLVYNC